MTSMQRCLEEPYDLPVERAVKGRAIKSVLFLADLRHGLSERVTAWCQEIEMVRAAHDMELRFLRQRRPHRIRIVGRRQDMIIRRLQSWIGRLTLLSPAP